MIKSIIQLKMIKSIIQLKMIKSIIQLKMIKSIIQLKMISKQIISLIIASSKLIIVWMDNWTSLIVSNQTSRLKYAHNVNGGMLLSMVYAISKILTVKHSNLLTHWNVCNAIQDINRFHWIKPNVSSKLY
jgi:hypothetical protein